MCLRLSTVDLVVCLYNLWEPSDSEQVDSFLRCIILINRPLNENFVKIRICLSGTRCQSSSNKQDTRELRSEFEKTA